MQGRLARVRSFPDGELLEKFQSASVRTYADRLATKYFPRCKSEGWAVFDDVRQLYGLYLVLAPVLQREREAFRCDWHRGHLLTWVRRQANSRVAHWWLGISDLPRSIDEDRLRRNLDVLGIHDHRFYDDVVRDLFLAHYGAGDIARSRLAAQIFDGIIFSVDRPAGLRLGNKFVRLEREQFPGAVDIRDGYAQLWDYQVRHVRVGRTGKIDILISNDRIETFRAAVHATLRARTTPAYRIILLERVIRDFVEHAKYAKSALPQILDLTRWIRQKIKRLSGAESRARALPEMLHSLFETKSCDRSFSNKPNFFWDPSRVPEHVYVTFFNPHREW